MMYQIEIMNSAKGEIVGTFEFAAVPRAGEMINVESETDPDGVRCFQVEEVYHVAKGAPFGDRVGPMIELRCDEIH